ncbi:hypothetical protein Csa_008815 [Cucumis sativus]|nr:hypothetical protein Csa_008815 [Cucumis sativus]
MKFGPISFCSRSYCDETIPLDQPKSSRRQGTTAALQQLDVHVEIICYCQKQRSLRPICSVFCSKSFFHNSQIILWEVLGGRTFKIKDLKSGSIRSKLQPMEIEAEATVDYIGSKEMASFVNRNGIHHLHRFGDEKIIVNGQTHCSYRRYVSMSEWLTMAAPLVFISS